MAKRPGKFVLAGKIVVGKAEVRDLRERSMVRTTFFRMKMLLRSCSRSVEGRADISEIDRKSKPVIYQEALNDS